MGYLAIPIPATSATSNINSSAIDANAISNQNMIKIGTINIQVVATSLSSADSTVKIQQTNDATGASNWVDVVDQLGNSASITLASGSSTPAPIIIAYSGAAFYRIVYTKNTNAAGTVQVNVNFS